MAYIGYSKQIPLFVKLLVDEFGNDYEGDSYLNYLEKIKSFLIDDISSDELLEFFDKSNFCIFELDHLIKSIDDLIQSNILYKQKLNKFIDENIDSDPPNNRIISLKGLSLLFDDFVDIYNEDIFDYESFYISIFGVFINLSQSKFMEFINDVIKYNSLTFEDFYFLVNFLKDIVEFKYLNKYVKEFILYSEDYLDAIDDSFEHISILMFLTFKLNKKFSDLCKNPKNDFWSKDKEFIIVILKLFSNYCREYNLVFIDQIDEQNKKFIENRDIIYTFLKYLTEFTINKEDCEVILSVYSRLMFDYKEYESVKKVTKIVRYLVSPIFKHENLDFLISSNLKQNVINILSFAFLNGINYVDLFINRCNKQGFNKEIGLYILKLILSEEVNTRKDYFIYFVEKLHGYLLDDFIYEDGNLFNYLLWITNDIINSEVDINGLGIVLNLLTNNKIHGNKIYNLINNITYKFDYEFIYSFEGISFYKSILNNGMNVYYGRMDREYFYAKNIFNNNFDDLDICKEKNRFEKLIIKYFKNVNASNRNEYYKNLLNNKYFDIYKFEILEKIREYNIDKEILKKECDFLIYNSPDEEGLKFGILLSLLFNEKIYEDIYKEIIFKVSYGDIFMRIQEKFKCFNVDEVFNLHKSCVFLVKWNIENNKNDDSGKLEEIAYNSLQKYYKKLDIYGFVYIVVLFDYLERMEVFNDVNSNTFRIKTIIKLIDEERDDSITNDTFIYEIFNKCFEVYTRTFVSLTQFEILEFLRTMIENKYMKFNFDIVHKDIELNNINYEGNKIEKFNFRFKYSDVLKKINKVFKSPEADEYYENIFISQNIDLIINILSNERKFYNNTMELFYKCINGYDNFDTISGIYEKSLENIFIGKVFIKLISNYPNVILNILKNTRLLEIYIKILECSF